MAVPVRQARVVLISLFAAVAPLAFTSAVWGAPAENAVDLGPDGRDPYYGYGRVSAGQAVQ